MPAEEPSSAYTAAVQPQPQPEAAPPPPPPPPVEPAPPPPPEPAAAVEPEPSLEPLPDPEPQPPDKSEIQPAAKPSTEPGGPAEIEVEILPEDAGKPLSEEELDAMLGRDAEPEPVESLVEADEDDVSREVGDADEMPEPEPIPAVFTAEEAEPEPESRSGRMRLIAAGVVLALVVVFGGLFLARDAIVSVMPSAAGLYDAVGLGPGVEAMLVRQESITARREFVGAQEVLVVRGLVMNTSAEAMAVPHVRVALYDADDQELQYVVVPPEQKRIDAGADASFRARIENPAASARQVKVTLEEQR